MRKPITLMYLKVHYLNVYFRSSCSYLECFNLTVLVVVLDSSISLLCKQDDEKNINFEVLKQNV